MKEVFEYILSLFKSRIFPLILVFAILVGVLIADNQWRVLCKRFIKFYTERYERCGDKRKNIRQEWCASCL